MLSPIAVAFPIYQHQKYLQRTLDGWSKVRGVEDAIFEFVIEPSEDDDIMIALCKAVDFCERRITINGERLGHARNVQRSMRIAFGGASDYAIQACDDFVPSTDLLELHTWHRKHYADVPDVLALTSGRDIPNEGGLAAVWRCQLIGALTGFHRDKWERLDRRWDEGYANWWEWVNRVWLQSGHYDVLFPALSRVNAIAEPNGDACFVANPPPQKYYEVQGKRERAIGFVRYIEEL